MTDKNGVINQKAAHKPRFYDIEMASHLQSMHRAAFLK
jgi:hypothetical protein